MRKQTKILCFGVMLVIAMFSFVSASEINMSKVVINDDFSESGAIFTNIVELSANGFTNEICNYSLNSAPFLNLRYNSIRGWYNSTTFYLEMGNNELRVVCTDDSGNFAEKNFTIYKNVSEVSEYLVLGDYILDDLYMVQILNSSSTGLTSSMVGYNSSSEGEIMFFIEYKESDSEAQSNVDGFRRMGDIVYFGESKIYYFNESGSRMVFWYSSNVVVMVQIDEITSREILARLLVAFPSDVEESIIQLDSDYEGETVSGTVEYKTRTKVVEIEVPVETIIYRDSCSDSDDIEVIHLNVVSEKKGFFERVFGWLF